MFIMILIARITINDNITKRLSVCVNGFLPVSSPYFFQCATRSLYTRAIGKPPRLDEIARKGIRNESREEFLIARGLAGYNSVVVDSVLSSI